MSTTELSQLQSHKQWDTDLSKRENKQFLYRPFAKLIATAARQFHLLAPVSLSGLKRAHCSCGNLELFVGVFYIRILFYCLPMTSKKIFGREQSLDTDGTSSMDAARGYAHFRTEAVSEAVTEAS